MKILTKTSLALLVAGLISCSLFGPQAQAVPITGAITFGGTVTLDTTSAGTATAVLMWHEKDNTGTPFVTSADGSFSGLTGSAATFVAPWSFNSGAIMGFWSVGGFTFDLISSHILFQGGGGVLVTGSGTISGNGFTPTLGTWSFTTQDPSAGVPPVFSFSASTGAPGVPDSGSTVALLGVALVGVEVIRRKLATA
jgi:hypothetical protein